MGDRYISGTDAAGFKNRSLRGVVPATRARFLLSRKFHDTPWDRHRLTAKRRKIRFYSSRAI